MKVIDCFMFGLEYELDLLEIRLDYLSSVVDFFVLVEASFTQLGDPKPLYFDANKGRFQKYLDRIVHIVCSTPVTRDYCSWVNENFQRNQIVKGLELLNLGDNDIIHISDLDEIPSVEGIKYYMDNQIYSLAGLDQDMYYYFLNTKANYLWSGCQLVRYKTISDGMSPQEIRNNRSGGIRLPVQGGWHFSYLGGAKAILAKINSVCESNAHEDFKDLAKLQSAIDSNMLHFNNAPLNQVDIYSRPYPNTLLQNIDQYSHLIKE